MGSIETTFDRIGDAKPMGAEYANRLGIGRHRLALKSFNLKETEKKKDKLLEVEFMVVDSTADDHEHGETRSWMFFLSGEWAEYGERRAAAFIETIKKCIGDEETKTGVFGMQLNDESQPGRGIVIEAEVWVARNKDGSAKVGKKSGEEVHNANFKDVAQDGEAIAAMRAEVENTEEPAPKAAAKAEPVKEPVKEEPKASVPAKGGLGLLKGLKK